VFIPATVVLWFCLLLLFFSHDFVVYFIVFVLCVVIDFLQVQTVTRFIAREPDELDLEEADVVSVYQKSPDGQCFVVVVNVAVISAVSHEERR